MFFQTSRGICVRKIHVCLGLVLLLAGAAFSQTPETVVASVNNIEITQKQVDDSVSAQVHPLQQQLYAIRKAALENLVTTKILERSEERRVGKECRSRWS